MEPIRILLVDDHAVVRAGLRALLELEPDLRVVGEAGTGDAGVALARELAPDVVVMDLEMPGAGGLEATRRLARDLPSARVLVLTAHGEPEWLMPVLEAGGRGILTKHCADRDLAAAVRAVAAGEAHLVPEVARVLASALRTPRREAEADLARLSGREREVLTLTAGGFSSTEIGERLSLSHKTVETYRERLMEKLGMRHRSELIRFALDHGLLTASR
jgi:two-component system response regulator NreC